MDITMDFETYFEVHSIYLKYTPYDWHELLFIQGLWNNCFVGPYLFYNHSIFSLSGLKIPVEVLIEKDPGTHSERPGVKGVVILVLQPELLEIPKC